MVSYTPTWLRCGAHMIATCPSPPTQPRGMPPRTFLRSGVACCDGAVATALGALGAAGLTGVLVAVAALLLVFTWMTLFSSTR